MADKVAVSIARDRVVTVASELGSASVIDKDRVDLLGRNTESDGGGQPLVYDRNSSATIDGGNVFPGKNGTLSFNGTTFDGDAGDGRFLAIEKHAHLRRFGCSGGGADDRQPANRAVKAAAENDDIGIVFIPAGRFLVNMAMTTNNPKIKFRGTGSASIIESYATNDFALRIKGQFPELCDVSDLKIDGGNKAKHGVYFNCGAGVSLRGCEVTQCGLGVVFNATIGGVISGGNINRSYCAVYYTTRVGDLTVSDVAGQTVTLDAATFAQHSGFQYLDNVSFDINTIGIYQDQLDNPFSLRSNISIRNGLFQNGNVGIWLKEGGFFGDYPMVVDHAWFENKSDAGPFSFNGDSIGPSDIYMESGRLIGESIRPSRIRTRGISMLELRDPVFNSAPTFDVQDQSSVIVRRPFLDAVYIDKETDEWSIYTSTPDRTAAVRVSERTNRIVNGPLRANGVQDLSSSGAITVDFDAGTHERKLITLNGNVSITLAAINPGTYWCGFKQDATGGRTVTWTTTVSGAEQTLRTGANEYTLQRLYYDGTDWSFVDYPDTQVLAADSMEVDNWSTYNEQSGTRSLITTDGPPGFSSCIEYQAQSVTDWTGPRLYVPIGGSERFRLMTVYLRGLEPSGQSVQVAFGPAYVMPITNQWQCYGNLILRGANQSPFDWFYVRVQSSQKVRVGALQVLDFPNMEAVLAYQRSKNLYFNQD